MRPKRTQYAVVAPDGHSRERIGAPHGALGLGWTGWLVVILALGLTTAGLTMVVRDTNKDDAVADLVRNASGIVGDILTDPATDSPTIAPTGSPVGSPTGSPTNNSCEVVNEVVEIIQNKFTC